jgi:hypothetical protein
MARPLKDKAEVRARLMQVRVQEREYEQFKQAAGQAGLDVSGWVRERLLQAAKKELRK